MKITDQAIPPELQADYDQLIVNSRTTPAGIIITKTTKKARAKKTARKARRQLRDYENAVDYILKLLEAQTGKKPSPDLRAEQIDKLKHGIFDEKYWTECELVSETTFENEPTYGPYEPPRNYAYPDPDNQPSTPSYTDGITSTGQPRYEGKTIDGVFRDTYFRWTRYVFELPHQVNVGDKTPLFIEITGDITADTDIRATRAGISLVIKHWLIVDGDPRASTAEPPVYEPLTAYYRYRTPRGISPFWHYQNTLQLVYNMRSEKYEPLNEAATKLVLLIAPMPMMGYRYNNNTTVTTEFTGEVKLWQAVGGKFDHCGYYIDGTGTSHACAWRQGKLTTLAPLREGGATSASTITDDGLIIGGTAIDATGRECLVQWVAGTIKKITSNSGGVGFVGVEMSKSANAFCWTTETPTYQAPMYATQEGAVSPLQVLPDSTGTECTGISRTASKLCGGTNLDARRYGWRATPGAQPSLVGTEEGVTQSDCYAVAADGSPVVGYATVENLQYAAYWGIGTDTNFLPGAQPGWDYSATAANADGSVIAGAEYAESQQAAVYWDNDAGPLYLEEPAGATASTATAVSQAGDKIAAVAVIAGSLRAFIWSQDRGAVLLESHPSAIHTVITDTR